MNVLTATLMETDPKIGCIWFMERGETVVRTYPRRGTPRRHGGRRRARRLVAELRDDSGPQLREPLRRDPGLEPRLPGPGRAGRPNTSAAWTFRSRTSTPT